MTNLTLDEKKALIRMALEAREQKSEAKRS